MGRPAIGGPNALGRLYIVNVSLKSTFWRGSCGSGKLAVPKLVPSYILPPKLVYASFLPLEPDSNSYVLGPCVERLIFNLAPYTLPVSNCKSSVTTPDSNLV